ncbi:hypothetical protein CR513_00783, partial [Mucuna pruriens]
MPTSIYKSLDFVDREPTRMTIQLANRSVVQPLGVLKDVLVQVNELIFSTDFYVLDIEDQTSGKWFTLILGRSFFMTVRTKIQVHIGTLSMEFGDNLVQLNIFEAMKHPTKDPSLFGMDVIDELVEEHMQLDTDNDEILNFAKDIDVFDCLGSVMDEPHYDELLEVQDLSNSVDNLTVFANFYHKLEFVKFPYAICKYDENPECLKSVEVHTDPRPTDDISPSPSPPVMIKSLPSHLKYAYLGNDKKFLIIIASNLHWEQEEKLMHVLRQHQKAIGWKLSDLLGINPSVWLHKILMEEEARPIRQQQRRLNLTILEMVKKEVMKLLVVWIIYPILDNQWVSPVQVDPKKSEMTIMKN